MTTKTHLIRQEESINESGIQIRLVDPVAPTEGQLWLNTAENKLKTAMDGLKRVVASGGAFGKDIEGSTTIDLSSLDACQKRSDSHVSLALTNVVAGKRLSVAVSNIGAEVITVNFTSSGAVIYDEDFSGAIESGQVGLFSVLSFEGYVLVSSSVYPA